MTKEEMVDIIDKVLKKQESPHDMRDCAEEILEAISDNWSEYEETMERELTEAYQKNMKEYIRRGINGKK